MTHTWQSALDRGGAARALFVDFRMAFDSVNHNLLLRKLYSRNVPHCLIRWFFSYLENRIQRVRIGTNHSSWLQLNGAVSQGSWLGPLTFILLIDDLQVNCLAHKYVDDMMLIELLQGRNKSSNMQNFSQQVLNWSNINDMLSISLKQKRWSWPQWHCPPTYP